MKRAAVGLLAVAVFLLTGCSSGGGDGGGDANGDQAGDKPSGPLAGLDGDNLCGMVDRATIEEQFHEKVRDAQGGPGRPDQRESVSCIYVTESLMESEGTAEIAAALSISTKVRLASDKATTAKEALDAYLINFDDKTVNYVHIDGLGEAAGYAGSELDVLTGGNHLVAILEVDGTFIEVITRSEPEGTQDQLRPIADELVAGVESKLR